MLVDIYTLHNAYNYGAFLQAYAMQEVLGTMGASVRFRAANAVADPDAAAYGSRSEKLGICLRALTQPRMALHYFIRNRRMRRSAKLLNTDTGGGRAALCLLGSDEIWNISNARVGFVPEFFGIGTGCKKVAAYAVSAGRVFAPELPEEAAEAIGVIDSFSARDGMTRQLYEDVTGKNCEVVLDPVFLYDWKSFTAPKKARRPYLLIYGRFTDSDIIEAVKAYADSHAMQTLSSGIYNGWCDRNTAPDPFGFLSQLMSACGVVTNTFHGTAFSLIFGKHAAVLPETAKVGDLLRLLGAKTARCDGPGQIVQALSRPITDTAVNAAIDRYRVSSHAYLNRALGMEPDVTGS